MKTLYFDCGMGAAGDMLTAALIELFPNRHVIADKLNAIGIPGISFIPAESQKCGIKGTRMHVMYRGMEEGEVHSHDGLHHEHAHEHIHDHSHNGMAEITHILSRLNLSEKVRTDVLAVYDLIASAESEVHGVPANQIHFHEVGNMDAIADITAVCYLIDQLKVDRIICSPIHVGSGQVRCAHGILPVPAPATALILKDIPIYGGEIRGELCTPTGAALLKYFVSEFGPMPTMKTTAIGYGMGKKDFPAANCVRTMLGEAESKNNAIIELSCNLDDITGEELGFAMEMLLTGGALDVFTIPIQMKKNRLGHLLRVICREENRDELVRMIFCHTTTLGIREQYVNRYTLDRTITTVDTPYGPIRQKVASGYGVERKKFEYNDLARVAKEQGVGIREILNNI